jgi:uncharacterized protein
MTAAPTFQDITALLNAEGEMRLRVVPGAKVERLAIENATVKIWIRTAPEDGKANKAVIALLAKTLEIPSAAVAIISGHASRDKRVRITLCS